MLGFGLSAVNADAATPIQTVTKGGVTCSEYSTGFSAFPKTYWDCVNPSNPTGAETSIGSAANTLQTTPTNLKSSLTNVQIYTFKNATDFASFTGAPKPAANAFGGTATNVAAAFASATQNGATVDLTGVYSGSIVQELGHLIDAAQTAPYSSNAVFTTAIAYDIANLNAQGNSVWPSGYYTKYPGKTNWQILQAIYPSANTDIFDYQFQANNGSSSTNNDLRLALSYMPNTLGWVENYVYLATPVNAAAATGGVLCVQWHTNFTYPSSWWDCVHPYNPTGAEDQIPYWASTLSTSVKSALTNVSIYAFKDAADFATFTGSALPAANAFGATAGNLAATFSTTTQNGVAVDLTNSYPGTITQELGHIVDEAYGTTSATTTFQSDLTSDIATINNAGNIWPSAYYTKYPSDTNWEILQAIYPSADSDIFDYQFMLSAGYQTGTSLDIVIENNMPSTKSYVSSCFGGQPAIAGRLRPQANPTCTLTPTSNNGIKCVEHLGGSYPEDGHYFDCTTQGTYGAATLTELKKLVTQYANVTAKLKANNVQWYVFDNAVTYQTYSTAGTCCTDAQKQSFYQAFLTLNGITTNPAKNPGFQASIIWGFVGNGPYPSETAVQAASVPHTTAHETGHSFDFSANGSSYPSYGTGFNAVAQKDITYMQANDPTYSSDINTYKYWLQINSGTNNVPSKQWAELFAEEFAVNTQGSYLAVDSIITKYWACSNFYTLSWMKNNRAPTSAEYTAAGLSRCN